MTIPLIILTILSFAFVFTFPSINPLEGYGWFTSAVGKVEHVAGLDMYYVKEQIHHAHYQAMYTSLVVATIGIMLSALFYLFNKVNVNSITKSVNMFKLYDLSYNKFYIDCIYSKFLYKPFMCFSKFASKVDWDLYDQKFIDSFGWITLKLSDKSGYADYTWLDQKLIDGFGRLSSWFGSCLRRSQGGVLQNYLMAGIVGIVTLLFIFQQL